MSNPLFQKITNQIQNQIIQDDQGGINPIAREYIMENYEVFPFSFKKAIPTKKVHSDYDTETQAILRTVTTYIFTADCGHVCTFDPTDTIYPYVKAITYSKKASCSLCLRTCISCYNLFMLNEGKYVHRDFVCNKHLFLKQLELLAFHSSKIYFEYEEKSNLYKPKARNKNEKFQSGKRN